MLEWLLCWDKNYIIIAVSNSLLDLVHGRPNFHNLTGSRLPFIVPPSQPEDRSTENFNFFPPPPSFFFVVVVVEVEKRFKYL